MQPRLVADARSESWRSTTMSSPPHGNAPMQRGRQIEPWTPTFDAASARHPSRSRSSAWAGPAWATCARASPKSQAIATIEAAHAAGIGYFDTSPWYGNGKSELRFGHVLRTKPRNSFVLSTKVGRVHARPADPDTYTHPGWAGGLPFEPRFDYTRDGILKSYEMSLARLGLNRVEALLIHDLDPRHQKSEEGVAAGLRQLDGGGWRALADLKARGEIAAIGVGVNLVGMIPRFLERWPIDFFLVAMPYTLLEQEGLEELESCAERGVSIVIGAPYASGILVRGPQTRRTLRLPAGQTRDRCQGGAHRRCLPAPRRAARRGRPAVSVGAQKRRFRDPGSGRDRGGAPQPRLDASRHCRCALGRAQGRRAHPCGCADAALARIELTAVACWFYSAATRSGPSSTGRPRARRIDLW